MAFFIKKSLLCRYSALSLHPGTDERSPHSGSSYRSALSFDDVALARQSKQASSALTLRNVRSAFALGLLPKMDARRIQNGRKQTSTSPMLLSDEPKE